MMLAISGQSSRQIVMTEAKAVNKYTLVPIGMVLAAVVATTAVNHYLGTEKTALAVLKSENAAIRREFESYKQVTDGKLGDYLKTLHGMDTAIKLIAQKLEVDLPEPP